MQGDIPYILLNASAPHPLHLSEADKQRCSCVVLEDAKSALPPFVIAPTCPVHTAAGDCGRSRKAVVTEGIGQDGRPFVAVDGKAVHVVHELVQDSAGRVSLSIIPQDWTGRVLDDTEDGDG